MIYDEYRQALARLENEREETVAAGEPWPACTEAQMASLCSVVLVLARISVGHGLANSCRPTPIIVAPLGLEKLEVVLHPVGASRWSIAVDREGSAHVMEIREGRVLSEELVGPAWPVGVARS